ncbi:hypothetical protein [Acidimangrovimonas pyrenivorans]|uniref:Uncharacterized protein n=1 Tax=Acidimangrovimonas pyrenivorans TaxID=2030798 RepID=A0ABV7AMZ4_9RHOB
MSARQLCRLTQITALAALAATVFEMGLAGLPVPGPLEADGLVLVAVLAALAGLGLLRRLAAKRRFRLPEFEGALARTVVMGVIFLSAVYHLSGMIRLFAPVRVALDALLPAWADTLLALAPGLLLLVLAELILRRPPGEALQ